MHFENSHILNTPLYILKVLKRIQRGLPVASKLSTIYFGTIYEVLAYSILKSCNVGFVGVGKRFDLILIIVGSQAFFISRLSFARLRAL